MIAHMAAFNCAFFVPPRPFFLLCSLPVSGKPGEPENRLMSEAEEENVACSDAN